MLDPPDRREQSVGSIGARLTRPRCRAVLVLHQAKYNTCAPPTFHTDLERLHNPTTAVRQLYL